MVEMVVNLKNHFDEERESQEFVPTKDPAGRTAAGLGVGIATVKRIMARYSKSGEQVVALPAKRPGRPPARLLENLQPVVRRFIRSENRLATCRKVSPRSADIRMLRHACAMHAEMHKVCQCYGVTALRLRGHYWSRPVNLRAAEYAE